MAREWSTRATRHSGSSRSKLSRSRWACAASPTPAFPQRVLASANIFFLPAAGKLNFKHRKRMIIKEMMLEGTLGILEGQNPRLIEGRLTSFLDEEYQKLREQEAALRSRRKAA